VTPRAQELQERFRRSHGREARVYAAPGRVNLIGEHTDYNDGFVLPAAIDLRTWVAIAPRADRRLRVASTSFPDEVDLDLGDAAPRPGAHWSDYVRGIAGVLERAGRRLSGADLLVHGEVPIGSGLSSSAALCVAAGYALLDSSGCPIDRVELARFAQQAEHEYVGTRCGIMDPFVSCFGEPARALLLDCRSLSFELVPLPADVSLVVSNTMVKHALAGGEYNRRRAECEEGVRQLARSFPEVRALRDVDSERLEAVRGELSEVVYRRCRHVIGENARVVQAAQALRTGDLSGFGRLMAESHRSLRDDYEVSCAELNTLVELANEVGGVYGTRMTGGGFGGCTVSLVRSERAPAFERHVADGYEKATGRKAEIYVCAAGAGAARERG